MKNIKSSFRNTWIVALTSILVSSIGALADDVTTMKQALEIALKDKTIAAEGDKAKLYSATANNSGSRINYSFRFYTGGDNLHNVSVDKTGKTRYSAYSKGSSRVFDDLDFLKLPAPTAVLVEGAIEQSKKALAALGFEVLENGKYTIFYSLTSEYRQKDKPQHSIRVSLPVKDEDPKKGKSVVFTNGKIDQVSNTTIY